MKDEYTENELLEEVSITLPMFEFLSVYSTLTRRLRERERDIARAIYNEKPDHIIQFADATIARLKTLISHFDEVLDAFDDPTNIPLTDCITKETKPMDNEPVKFNPDDDLHRTLLDLLCGNWPNGPEGIVEDIIAVITEVKEDFLSRLEKVLDDVK